MVSRIPPSGPVTWYQTYRVTAPVQTHWRKATCAEIDCVAYLHGWKTTVDLSTDLGAKQAHYITKESRRKFTIQRINESLIEFTFEAGQPCFARDKHRIQLDRPENYSLFMGDYRGRQGDTVRFYNVDDWMDHFATHQEKINRQRQ